MLRNSQWAGIQIRIFLSKPSGGLEIFQVKPKISATFNKYKRCILVRSLNRLGVKNFCKLLFLFQVAFKIHDMVSSFFKQQSL